MGKKWPVQMNLPFFAVKAHVPGGVQNQAEKIRKIRETSSSGFHSSLFGFLGPDLLGKKWAPPDGTIIKPFVHNTVVSVNTRSLLLGCPGNE